ncbi:MAG: protein kinase domain-containing protein [Planctomycetota bacterium]|jgi:tetratricopeptide (TPR) repeat protein
MPKQSDIDFANEVLRQGLTTKEVVEECLTILKNLNEVGVDDALDGIMCLKGHLKETQVSDVWNKAFSREFDDDVEEVFTLEALMGGAAPGPADAPAEAEPPLEEVAPTEPPAAPAEGLPKLPGFTLESKLEKDSTGINYLASPKGKNRKSIVHILYPQVAGDQRIMGWLIKHGRQLAKLEHPSAAVFYPVQALGNRAFFAQEIPQGEPLPVVLEEGEFEEERALLLIEQVAEVLQHAEEKKVHHGRLTPKNIFVLEDNLVEVRFFTYTDRERTLFLEKPEAEDLAYLSPEIRSKKPPSTRSDLFSLGKILLHMTEADQESPKKLSESCRRIVGKMIALVPSKRYGNVKGLLKDLERYFEGREISETVEEEAPPTAKAAAEPTAKQPPSKKGPAKVKTVPLAMPVEEDIPVARRAPSGRARRKAGPPPKKTGPPLKKASGKTRMMKGGPKAKKKGSGARPLKVEKQPIWDQMEGLLPDAEPQEVDSRVIKGIELADKREAKGDLGGAVEALLDIEELAENPAPIKERIVDLRSRGFARARKDARAKEAEGDYKGAAKIFDRARVFVEDPEDIDEVIALLEDKHEEIVRNQELAKLEEKAKARADEGDVMGAVALLEEAKTMAPNPLTVQNKINGLRKKAYDERIAECQERGAEGDIDGAIQAAQRAKEYTDSEDAVDAIVRNLERNREKASKQAEYKRCEEEALKRAEAGDVEGAIECYERAKTYAVSAIAVEAKIEDLRNSTYEGFLADARECEEAGRFKDAILAWEKSRPHAPDPEEVEAAIQVLRDRLTSAEKEKALERLRTEAAGLEKDGQIAEAIKKLQEGSKIEKGPSYSTRLKIDKLQKRAFDDGVAESNKLKEKGDIKGAIEAVESVRRFATDPKAVDLIVATLKREKTRSKRARDFRKLEGAAKTKAKEGDILASLKILEKAKEFAESPLAVQAKIDGLRKATFDRLMGGAKEKEVAGDWTEAENLYTQARDFADNPGRIDEIIETIRIEIEKVRAGAERGRLLDQADALVAEGKVKDAVAKLEEAKRLVDNPEEIQERIDSLLIGSMFQKTMELAKKKEEAGDIAGAIEVATKAKAYTKNPAEVDERLTELQAKLAPEEAAEAPAEAPPVEEKPPEKPPAEEKPPEKPPEEPPAEEKPPKKKAAKKKKAVKKKAAKKKAAKKKEPPKEEAPPPEAPLPEILPVGEKKKPKKKKAKAKAEKEPAKKDTGKLAKKGTGKLVKRKTGPVTVAGTHEIGPDLILVVCPNGKCKKEFRVKSKFEGRKGKCPACGSAVDVPVSGEKVVCFLCDKVLPKSKARVRGDEFYCSECEDFIGG